MLLTFRIYFKTQLCCLDTLVLSLLSSVVSLSNVWSDSLVDTVSSSEVSQGLSGSWGSEQPGVGAGWGNLGQLVEGVALSSGALDSVSGRVRELEGADLQLWNGEESLVVEDVSDDAEDLGLLVVGVGELGQSGDGDWVSGDVALVESLVNNLVEVAIGSSAQESVQLED